MPEQTLWTISLEATRNDLRHLVHVANHVLDEPEPLYDAPRHGQLLLIRLLLTSSSLIRMLEIGRGELIDRSQIDPFSVASLVRDLVEAHDVLRYLYLESIPPEEERFRFLLYAYHQGSERAKIREMIRLPRRELERNPFTEELMHSMYRRLLEKDPIFLSLTAGQQKEILRGRIAFLRITRPDFKSLLGNAQFTRGMYKLLSNVVHAHPAANTMLLNLQWPEWLDFEELLDVSIGYGTLHLAEGIRAFVARRRLGVKLGVTTTRHTTAIVQRYTRAFLPFVR